MSNTSKLTDKSIVPDYNPANSLGAAERQLLIRLTGPQEPLDYPMEDMEMANGCIVKRYVIPDTDKEKVLAALYPFTPCPTLDEVRLDIHTEKKFTVRDFMVTREGDGNFLVTPYYAEAGGTVLDWIKCPKADEDEDDDVIISVQTISKGKPTMTAVAICKE